jgi:hypothetical protein
VAHHGAVGTLGLISTSSRMGTAVSDLSWPRT